MSSQELLRDLADQIEAGLVTSYVCYAAMPNGLLVVGNEAQGIGATMSSGVAARNWRERLALAWSMIRRGRWDVPVYLQSQFP